MKSCAECAKSHVDGNRLQCRAQPPAPEPITGLARFPFVHADDFCHDGFAPKPAEDAPAPRARRARSGPTETPLAVPAAELPLA